MRRHLNLIAACILSVQISTAAGAVVSSSDLRAMRTELNIEQDRWIQDAEAQLPEWWRQRILEKARELEKEGLYQEALDNLLRVNKICPHPEVNLQLALCYAHLHRKDEALAFMPKLPDYVWTVKAEIYTTLGMYKESLAACDDPTLTFDEPVLRKAFLLLAHGEREAAIQTAQNEYWHLIRIGQDSEKLASFLEQLNVELTPPPQIRTFNQPVKAFLKTLPRLEAPTITGLEKTFDRTFVVYSKESIEKYSDADTPRLGQDKYSYISLTHNPYDLAITLKVSPGVESTFISISDVRQLLHNEGIHAVEEQTISETTCDHCNGKLFGGGTQLDCASKNGHLQFSFLKNGQLNDVQKTWNVNPVDAKKNRQRLEVTSVGFLESDLELVELKLKRGEYRDAAQQLLSFWSSIDSKKPNYDGIYQLRQRKRNLLVRCYAGMNRSDIADYLKVAPLDHIRNLAAGATYLPFDKLFPTYDEYMKTKWKVSGNSSTPDGGYYVWGTSACTFCVYPTSPLFPKFYALLGPMASNSEAMVPPLPGTLVDSLLAESNR